MQGGGGQDGGAVDPRERLKETLKALGRGDFLGSKQQAEFNATDQSIPWDLAYHVAVQKEASRVSLAASAPPLGRSSKRPAGNHAGPASLMTNRIPPIQLQAPGNSVLPDPFSRTSVGVTNPTEVSWRAAVSHTPAFRRAVTSTLDASPGTPPQPFNASRTDAITSLPASKGTAASMGGAAAAVMSSAPAPGRLAPPAGWSAPQGVTGSSPMLKEVPEAFWRTVAPDVHHEMLEYLYDFNSDQGAKVAAMIAALKAKKAVPSWAVLPGNSGVSGGRDNLPSTAAELAVILGLMAPTSRPPGYPALSRWYKPDGTSTWEPCTVVQSAPDGATYAIRWHHTGGIKTVSRFNILFDGETEDQLRALRETSLQYQKKLQYLSMHVSRIRALPDFDAPMLPEDMAASILTRLGGYTLPQDLADADSNEQEAADVDAQPEAAAGGVASSQAFLKLRQLQLRNKLGLPTTPPPPDPAATCQAATQQLVKEAVHARKSQVEFRGWRLGQDSAWRPFLYPEADKKLQLMLEDAASQYAAAHNKLAYHAAFQRETGLQVPQKLEDLLIDQNQVEIALHRLQHLNPTLLEPGGQAGNKKGQHKYFYPASKPAPERGTVKVVDDEQLGEAGQQSPEPDAAQEGEQGLPGGEQGLGQELSMLELAMNQDQPGFESPEQEVFREAMSRASSFSSLTLSARQELAGSRLPDPSKPGSRPVSGQSSTLLESRQGAGSALSFQRHADGQAVTPMASQVFGQDGVEDKDEGAASMGQPTNTFTSRLASVQRTALVADVILLKAWQQSLHYLTDIQRRDVFGLKQLPLRSVYESDTDVGRCLRWRRYLDTRKPPAELAAHGPVSKVAIFMPEDKAEPVKLSETVNLVAFLNILEGARTGELADLRNRVMRQLALIVMDAAQEALTESIDDWEIPQPAPAQLHKYGNFPSLDPVVRAALAARAAKKASAHVIRFDQDNYYRLASLLNVALFDSIKAWLVENIQVYTAGLALYAAPAYRGHSLFHAVLDAIGDEIRYTPSLEVIEARLIESVTTAVASINSLPGLKVVQRQQSVIDASSLPFDVVPSLEMPTLLGEQDKDVSAAIDQIKALVSVCRVECDKLVSQFSRHLSLLSLDSKMLKSQLGPSRSALSAEDWHASINKYRTAWQEIADHLPLEVDIGLMRVQCISLKRRLAERAERLTTSLLLTLQEDAEELSNLIIGKLQPLYDIISQPLTDLGAVRAVREAAAETPQALLELTSAGQQLAMIPDLLHTYHHLLPDESFERIWTALRLPLLVEEAVSHFNSTVHLHEDVFLSKLQSDKEAFEQQLLVLAGIVEDWSQRHQEELVDEFLALGQDHVSLIKEMTQQSEMINKQEVLAGWPATNYTQLQLYKRQLMPYIDLWKLVRSFKDYYHTWMYGPLFSFDMELCETSVPAWTKLAARLSKDLRGPPQSVASKYSQYLMDFEGQLPLLRALRTQGLRQRHWARIHTEVPELASFDKTQLTLHMLLQAGMHRHAAVLRDLADLAARELVIEQAINNISTAFMALRVNFTMETDSGIQGIKLMTNGNDLIKFMDDAQLRVKGLSTSVYVDPHKESVIQWDEVLSNVRNVLESWLEVQARWSHLAPLFGPSGLATQLPLEARRFLDVTREWRKAINATCAHGQLSELLRHSELPLLLADLSKGLENVHKGVMEFLEEKRGNFPRFYFLSNNEMVNILVRSHDAEAVEPYLGRCFPGIGKLALSREWGVRIEGIISPESEQLLLRNPVELVDYGTHKGVDLEVWMMNLEKQMRIAMRETLKAAIEALVSQAFDQWLTSWPAQAILLTGALVWCREVTECFKANRSIAALEQLSCNLGGQVLRVVRLIQGGTLTPLQRGVLENVILVKVYQRDVLTRLIDGRVENVEDIEWLRVMRCYQEGEVVVRVGYSQISYGQEYLGNTPRLVITPLTERAFSSLVTAVHLHYGGAPEGPAGTGKTETVKELARGIAKQCIIFNTTEQLDIMQMTRLLMGIACTGAWSCFDEFNRIDMEVLSVVAKQIMTIQAALSTGERFFMFEGRNLGINNTLAMFITMNPMYEFRNVLPSNLKALFRPVAMMVPDYRLIAEVQLYAAGFQTAGSLAAHLVSVLKIASHRLSSQAHYDFAMRTLKSVLLIAAQLRSSAAAGHLTHDQEASLVRVALLRCNISKLRAQDAQIFMSVVDREFPQPGSADEYLDALKEHIRASAEQLKMHPTEELITRCLQTYSMLQIRTGVMLLGPAACGKTTVVRVLAGALSLMDAEQGIPPVNVKFIFPKAVSSVRLYGQYNSSTQTWEDGVLTAALRDSNARNATNRAWMVMDGPVDHIWVEALNPVLDDNRMLCLASGESIPLRQGLSFIMEVDSIAMASPATISRCGMVYQSQPSSELFAHQISSWCEAKLPPVMKEYAHKVEATTTVIFGELVKAYSDSLDAESLAPKQQPNGLLTGVLRLLGSMMVQIASKVIRDCEPKSIHACIEAAILLSLVWSFEACLPPKARAFFNILVRQMCARTIKYTMNKDGHITEHSSVGFQLPIPPDGQVFDFMFEFDSVMWISWKEYVGILQDPPKAAALGPDAFIPFGMPALMQQATVPASVRNFVITADNLPALYLMRLLMASKSNVLLMGITGTGKSALVNALLDSADDWLPLKEDMDDGDVNNPWRDSLTGSLGSETDMPDSRPGSARPGEHGQHQNALVQENEGGSRNRNALTIMPLTLSSQSTAANTRSTVQSYMVKRRKGVVGPPVGKLAVMFVDDLSAAGKDQYGTQGALEVIRQWCATGGWHDELKATFMHVVDTQLVGCLTSVPFKRLLSDRMLQYVSLLALPPISHAGFNLIFTAVLKRYMNTNTVMHAELMPALVSATMELYRHVTSTLLPVPSRPHYLFSIRHVGAVFKSMFHAHRASRSTPHQLVRLWQHECCRVFYDRIFDVPTRQWFDKILDRVTQGHLTEHAVNVPPPVGSDVVFITFASFAGSAYELADRILEPDRGLSPDTRAPALSTPTQSAPETPRVVAPSPVPDKQVTLPAVEQPTSPGLTDTVTPAGSPSNLVKRRSGRSVQGSPRKGERVPESGAPSESPSPRKSVVGQEALAAAAAVAAGAAAANPPGTPELMNLPLPPPPMSNLMKLYASGWTQDGVTDHVEAVHKRLTEIASLYAKEFLDGKHGSESKLEAKSDDKDKPAAQQQQQEAARNLGKGIAPDGGLVVFKTALMHLARITRVLSMEQGHMILVGPNGSGRRTLASLACHMSHVTAFEANLKDGQKGFVWMDVLKNVMHTAGVLGRPTCLLLVDVGRPADRMLDDVSHLMASAHLPGLFKHEEMQTIIKSLKPVARAAGIHWSETDRTGASDVLLHKFFIDRCRANMHVMMVLEQHDASLQRLIVSFPKMFHLATIDVMDDWDRDAREQVAYREFVSPAVMHLTPAIYTKAITTCCDMHDVAKQVAAEFSNKSGGRSVGFVTAAQYLHLLQHIKKVLPKKRAGLVEDREKYLEGVAKMTDMTAKLKTLQDAIAAMQPRLQERQMEASQLMALIQEEKAEAEAAKVAITLEEEQAATAASKKAALVAECEAELSKVMPPLVKALKELRAIDKASIAELKVMKSPPEGVKLVMRAICIMLGVIPDMVTAGKIKDETMLKKAWWEESIRVLADLHFLDALLLYDKDTMTPEMTRQVSAFTVDPAFDPNYVARSSQSAAALAKWVLAMDDYQRVKKVVDPKREALKLAEGELAMQEARLAQARQRLADINEAIKQQEQRYGSAVAAQEALAADIETAQQRVSQAQKVLNAVRKEVERWTRNAEASELRYQQVLGEALLSAGYFAYLGPLPGSYRLQAEAGWKMILEGQYIPMAPGFSLAESMGDPSQLEIWRDAGLPQSRTAVENVLIMEHLPRWTLLVDPQELGNAFLRGYYGGESNYGGNSGNSPLARGQLFLTVDQSDLNFKSTMLHAIESGAVLLLENLDEDMDDLIEQVLQQNTFQNQRGEVCIKLGEASAVYNPRFRLFVTTRQRAPRFPFNVVRHMCVCNFSITKAQLGELLITATLRHEMPELEAEHGQLIKQRAKNASEIISLEEQMLTAINTTSTEALLEESQVYTMLVALQDAAANIKAKVQRIEESQRRINDVRASIDKHLVSRVAVLFFVLQDMSLVRHTYQYSLKWFSNLFREALSTCPRSNTGRERLESLTLHFIGMLYTGASQSLFDEDKRPFAVLVLTRYMLAGGMCTKEEANLLLFGRTEQGKSSLARLTDVPSKSSQATSKAQDNKQSTGGAKAEAKPEPVVEQAPAEAPAAPAVKNPAFDGMFKGGRVSRLAKATHSKAGAAGGAPPKPEPEPQEQEVKPEPAEPPAETKAEGEGQEGEGEGGETSGPKGAAEELHQAIEERKRQERMKQLASAGDEENDAAIGGKPAADAAKPAGLMAPGSMPDFLEMSAPAKMPDDMRPAWLSEDTWVRLRDLGKLWPYNKLLPLLFESEDSCEATQRYHVHLCTEGPETELPHPRMTELTPFQLLLVIRCLQPSAFLAASQVTVKHYLGQACTVVEPVELDAAFHTTQPGTPIVLIATSEQPIPQLMLYAEQRGIKVVHTAMGRGQGHVADKLIRASLTHPVWVVLENTHLAGDWMPQLCSLVQGLPGMKPHWDFRLWLTTVPTEEFPAVILQTCLKLVTDPPTGLKANLAAVMTSLPAELLATARVPRPDAALPAGAGREVIGSREARVFGPVWRQLVLRLSLFHAMLLERRHYRALGWRLPYEFSAADLNAAVKQVMQVHKEMGGLGQAEAELDAVNRALPGLLYVTGQCLYGGKVTHDWDRRLLVCLLQQHLMPGQVPPPPKGQPPSVPTIETLLPEKMLGGTIELSQVSKELRSSKMWGQEPGLAGLTAGAAVIRQAEQTRHGLNILKRVQLLQGAADSDSDAARPISVALGVAQDVGRQLPFTVLPTVLTGWAQLVIGKQTITTAAVRPAGPPSPTHKGTAESGDGPPPPPPPRPPHHEHDGPAESEASAVSPLAAIMAARAEKRAAKAKEAGEAPGGQTASGQPRPVNRARQLKMTESMSEAAADRWANLNPVEQAMMIQVFETEMACYQAVLSTVHSCVKMVTAAIKGYEAVTGEFQELIRQLSSNEVPKVWAAAGPGGIPVELATESIGAWVNDLCDRLEWMYHWAVDGPPLVWRLGMMARPKAFLTAIQQIHAARLDCAVGSLVWQTHILTAEQQDLQDAGSASTRDLTNIKLSTSSGQETDMLEATSMGCLISGVLLQGASWDRQEGTLAEAGESVIYTSMPLLWLLPVPEPTRSSSVVAVDIAAEARAADGAAGGGAEKPVPAAAGVGGNSGGASPRALTPTTSKLRGYDGEGLGALSVKRQHKSSDASGGARVAGSVGTLPASKVVRVRSEAALKRRVMPAGAPQSPRASGDGDSGGGQASTWEGSRGKFLSDERDIDMYVSPVYLYSHSWLGNKADVDDCLFELLLPPGLYSPQHWVTRNVVVLVCSDPEQLMGMQAKG